MNIESAQSRRKGYRSIFISDMHLGTRHCQAKLLSEFLETYESDRIYLVGDIIDGWRLRKSWYWPRQHAEIFDMIVARARQGVSIFYIPGNHDDFTRKFAGRRIRNIEIVDHIIHDSVDGRRYLVIHGDRFDMVVQKAKWLAYLGDRFYTYALTTNTWLNVGRAYLGLDYWSLGAFAKRHVKSFVSLVGQYERRVVDEVRRLELQGVICGHIHHAENRSMHGIHYLNTGDWVESCTAIVEHFDGTFEVIYWADGGRVTAR